MGLKKVGFMGFCRLAFISISYNLHLQQHCHGGVLTVFNIISTFFG